MSYAIKENSNQFDVYETTSKVLIKLQTNENHARELCRKLNLGSGFAGWTPPFFSEKYSVKEDI